MGTINNEFKKSEMQNVIYSQMVDRLFEREEALCNEVISNIKTILNGCKGKRVTFPEECGVYYCSYKVYGLSLKENDEVEITLTLHEGGDTKTRILGDTIKGDFYVNINLLSKLLLLVLPD